MFKKKCQSLDQIPFPRRYRKFKKSDHYHYYPNYHFHIPAHKQKQLKHHKNVNKNLSASQSTCDNSQQFHNVHHSSSSNSTNWRLNTNPNESTSNILKHDSDLSIHSSLSNQSNLSSISVNSSNFCNTSSQLNTTSGLPTSSFYSSSAPGHNSSLYYPGRLDKYRHILNRSNCTNNTSQFSGDYVDYSYASNLPPIINQSTNQLQQPTPPPLPRYSSYNSIRSNLTTPLHLTASQISLEFNTWYNQLQINQDEQQKIARKSVREWVRSQPLSILQLDLADREVLKIAGKCFFVLI